jgi:hypothetical protein
MVNHSGLPAPPAFSVAPAACPAPAGALDATCQL